MDARTFALGCLCLVLLPASLAWADPPDEIVKNRKDFLPQRRHAALGAKVIGILVHDAQPVLTTEGRSGPTDQVCFSEGGNSYRWVYVGAVGEPMITNLHVPVGDKGETVLYPALDMASPKKVLIYGIKTPYTLVEVSVNHEKGAPEGDSFVASDLRVVEGTKAYPIKTTEVIEGLKKAYEDYRKANQKSFDEALAKAQVKAIKDEKASGPRESQTLLYITWLAKEELLEVRFRTRVTDGAFRMLEGGNPFDLPPAKDPPAPRPEASLPSAETSVVAFPPPPPPRVKTRVGTGFGIEYGRAWQVDKAGATVRVRNLPPEDFIVPAQPVPTIRPRREAPSPFLSWRSDR